MAARKAEVESVLVMVLGDEKDADEQMAIQLSHNAIAGQDDLVILKELWESIKDVQARVYAGLDSDTLKALQGIQFAAISEQRLRYKLTNFLFLPEETGSLDQLLKETAVAFSPTQSIWLTCPPLTPSLSWSPGSRNAARSRTPPRLS